jgi:hypothetical protein
MHIVIVIIWDANIYLLQQFKDTPLCIITVEERDAIAMVADN